MALLQEMGLKKESKDEYSRFNRVDGLLSELEMLSLASKKHRERV